MHTGKEHISHTTLIHAYSVHTLIRSRIHPPPKAYRDGDSVDQLKSTRFSSSSSSRRQTCAPSGSSIAHHPKNSCTQTYTCIGSTARSLRIHMHSETNFPAALADISSTAGWSCHLFKWFLVRVTIHIPISVCASCCLSVPHFALRLCTSVSVARWRSCTHNNWIYGVCLGQLRSASVAYTKPYRARAPECFCLYRETTFADILISQGDQSTYSSTSARFWWTRFFSRSACVLTCGCAKREKE